MGYVYVLLTWLFVSLVWGGIGVAVGPGIMMLIIGWIVGVFGCLYSFGERLYGGQAQLRLAGLIVFVVRIYDSTCMLCGVQNMFALP